MYSNTENTRKAELRKNRSHSNSRAQEVGDLEQRKDEEFQILNILL